jgi:hypothetical protein
LLAAAGFFFFFFFFFSRLALGSVEGLLAGLSEGLLCAGDGVAGGGADPLSVCGAAGLAVLPLPSV